MLAGLSVEYYTRIERGQLGGASENVLDAIARALRLDDDERARLDHLARNVAPGSRRNAPSAPHPSPHRCSRPSTP
ncbi:helix-turn-helix transcriptional regulator [Amycolatopsis japonica]|uniref:helix-turn-helix domain-containing protein n=1 Tax=Amycolatopsis japonica TaxID=208439 RepID=UPI0033D828F5